MSKITELNEKIIKLQKAIASPATPSNIKESMKKAMQKLKDELANEPDDEPEPKPKKKHSKLEARQKKMSKTNPKFKKGDIVKIHGAGEGEWLVESSSFKEGKGYEYTIHNSKAKETEKNIAESKLKARTKPAVGSLYDCDDLIAKAKERSAKAKKRAKQPEKKPVTKAVEKIEKVEDKLKGMSYADLAKLLAETRALIKRIEAMMKKTK